MTAAHTISSKALGRREFMKMLGAAGPGISFFSIAAQQPGAQIHQLQTVPRRPGPEGLLTPEERVIVQKIIDGVVPPHLTIRQKLAEEDPEYDLVAELEQFVIRQGPVAHDALPVLLKLADLLPMAPFLNLNPPRQLSTIEEPEEITSLFLQVRDHEIEAIRPLFAAFKGIGTMAIYTNETVTWKEMRYPLPWVRDIHNPRDDKPTSFSLALETEQRMDTLREAVLPRDEITGPLEAAGVVADTPHLTLETDVVVVGSGAGGSVVAAEIAAAGHRVLVLEKGPFLEPHEFLQREKYMVPRVYVDGGAMFSSTDVLLTEVPNMDAALVMGRIVGGSATLNHALCFDIPNSILKEWNEVHGVAFTREELDEHFQYLTDFLPVRKVESFQVNRNNAILREGARKLGFQHHQIGRRYCVECRGCGHCDTGCRYHRKQGPLMRLLPEAARHGAQIIPDFDVERVVFSDTGSGQRRLRARGVIGALTDPSTGEGYKTVEVNAHKVILAGSAIGSSRVLLRSGIALHRSQKGMMPAVGGRFSCHAAIPLYGDFEAPVYPGSHGPPMSYVLDEFDADHNPSGNYNSFKWECFVNHPMSLSQVVPYVDPSGHWELMRRFNHIAQFGLIFRDRPSGTITPKSFRYRLADADKPRFLEALRVGARILFAAGAQRVFTGHQRPLILENVSEIPEKMKMEVLDPGSGFTITSAHLMGGCPMGRSPKYDVVDPHGQSWDAENLYVADASIFPTSIGVNPVLTIMALARAISRVVLERQG